MDMKPFTFTAHVVLVLETKKGNAIKNPVITRYNSYKLD